MSFGIDPTSLRAYTDAETLTNLRWAVANGCCGQTTVVNGRTISFPPLEQVLKAITFYEARVGADEGQGNIVLADFAGL